MNIKAKRSIDDIFEDKMNLSNLIISSTMRWNEHKKEK